MDLVKEYEKVLKEYDRLLNLSEQILMEIKGGMVEETLVLLLEEKQKIADNIQDLTLRIAQTRIYERFPAKKEPKANSNPRFDFECRAGLVAGQTLSQIESLLKQIRSKAKSFLKTEEKIKTALKETIGE